MNPNQASTTLRSDERSASSSLDCAIQDGSSVSNTREPIGGFAENVTNQSNGQKAAVMNGHNQQAPNEGEGIGKKKVNLQLKGKGIGTVPRNGSSAPGWTGAGFDVDGRT